MKKIEDHERRISKLEELLKLSESIPPPIKKMSIAEFLKSKRPKSDVQKTLIIGFYFEKYEGMKSFNVQDLEKGFRDAREKVLGNINLCVIKNIRKGHMMEANEKKDGMKAWCLTNSGIEFVESDLKEEN